MKLEDLKFPQDNEKCLPAKTSYPGHFVIPINIDPQKDKYIVKGGSGVAIAHVKKDNGEVYSMHMRANGAFTQMTHFDPAKISVAERRKLSSDLHTNGYTQSEIADLVGVSQPTVANDLKKIRQNREKWSIWARPTHWAHEQRRQASQG